MLPGQAARMMLGLGADVAVSSAGETCGRAGWRSDPGRDVVRTVQRFCAATIAAAPAPCGSTGGRAEPLLGRTLLLLSLEAAVGRVRPLPSLADRRARNFRACAAVSRVEDERCLIAIPSSRACARPSASAGLGFADEWMTGTATRLAPLPTARRRTFVGYATAAAVAAAAAAAAPCGGTVPPSWLPPSVGRRWGVADRPYSTAGL